MIGATRSGAHSDEGRMEPLELGVLAALTPPDIECLLFDERVEPIPYDEPVDLAAITVEIFTARRAYEIATEYRRRGAPVILGGIHASLAPEECLAHADAVFVGDAENGWGRVVEDARTRRLQGLYRATPGPGQAGGVIPRRDLFRGKGYLPIDLVQWSRGCHFACHFCAVAAYFERRHHVRPTREVLAEIDALERRTVFFVDDNFMSDREAAKRFLRELIPLRIRWVSQGSIDMTSDLELMDLVEASGGMGFVIGFESVSPQGLLWLNKAPNLAPGAEIERYDSACRVLRDHHLQTWASFTLGHDHETPESIRATFDFAMEQKFAFAAFNILMPYPRTPLYERLAREHRLIGDGQWWLDPEYRFNHAAFVPKRMSPDELTAAAWDCRERWSRTGSILRRLWDVKTQLRSPRRLAIYLGYNPLFRREVHCKQGMRLGVRARDLKKKPGIAGDGKVAAS
jgi:radical SAM superfamily enzyme YgiQ (UPF0313 family)